MIRLLTVFNWVALLFAASIVTLSLIIAYMLLVPIHIVSDWHVTVDEHTYHPGDDIVFHARYKKERDVSGTAYYYLECQSDNGKLVRYPISQTESNRPQGSGDIDVPMKLPVTIPSVPVKCRIAVSVDYTVYTFRKVTENNVTNYFTIAN